MLLCVCVCVAFFFLLVSFVCEVSERPFFRFFDAFLFAATVVLPYLCSFGRYVHACTYRKLYCPACHSALVCAWDDDRATGRRCEARFCYPLAAWAIAGPNQSCRSANQVEPWVVEGVVLLASPSVRLHVCTGYCLPTGRHESNISPPPPFAPALPKGNPNAEALHSTAAAAAAKFWEIP